VLARQFIVRPALPQLPGCIHLCVAATLPVSDWTVATPVAAAGARFHLGHRSAAQLIVGEDSAHGTAGLLPAEQGNVKAHGGSVQLCSPRHD
jgi:hypothetical protein